MTRIVPLFLLFAVACSNSASVPAPAPRPAGEARDEVVARIDGTEITLAEIDRPIQGELQKHREQMYQLRSNSLEQIVAERLLEKEAARRGVSADELLQQEVFAKVGGPSDEELLAFYEQFKGMPGVPPFEDAKERLRQIVSQEKTREATQAFFDRLKKEAKVEILLAEPEPLRMEVAAKGPSRGPENAPVTIVEFSDFECPFCARANGTLAQVEQAYAGKVRVVFRDFPLSFHRNAQKAAEAGHCADDQGKFWEMHDKMFANQKALDVDSLKTYAKELGLDMQAFETCLDSGAKAGVVQANLADGRALGVNGTPAFFINGRMISGALPFEEFKKVIDKELGVAVATP